MSLPRILIIGQPFNNNSGGGITQSNLFGAWEKDQLAVVCTFHMFDNLNTGICDNYYLLGNNEYRWMFPFNLLQRKVLSGPVKVKPGGKSADEGIKVTTKFRTRMINRYFYPFLEYIGLFHCLSRITLSENLCRWIDEYSPDVIYAQASTRETVVFCSMMQSYIRKPMIFHMMDDWPSTISERGPFRGYWRKKIDMEFRALLDKASVLLSISDYMATEYLSRYAKKFITFHNPIDIPFWKSHQRTSYELNSSPTLLYAGRIGTGIQHSLEAVAAATDMVRKELNIPVRFVIQTEDKPRWIEKYYCAIHHSLVPYSQLPMIFSEADLLLLPYDFSEESIRFVKYSMPTKAPEYMMSGTPVIVYAPPVTAIVKDAERNKWAKIVSVNQSTDLVKAIRELVVNESERKQTAGNAIKYAEQHFNSEKVRARFGEIICSLVNE